MSRSYYKPTEKEVLQDYFKAVDFLTISDENKLSKKIKELSDQTKIQEYVINGKLQEKDEQIRKLEESVAFLADKFNAFLVSQPGNRLVYHDENNPQIKGIELKPEIKNKALGQIKINPSSSLFNNKKK